MKRAAEMRVEIALDALAQIAAGMRNVEKMTYFVPQVPGGDVICEALPTTSCTVCAIGALFAATAALHIPHRSSASFGDLHPYLAKYFSMKQLRLIEFAFELWMPPLPGSCDLDFATKEEYQAALDFGLQYPTKYGSIYEKHNAKERLVAILENIVRNGGEFDPEDRRTGTPEPASKMADAVVLRGQDEPDVVATKALVLK